jgi:hypothetical protein
MSPAACIAVLGVPSLEDTKVNGSTRTSGLFEQHSRASFRELDWFKARFLGCSRFDYEYLISIYVYLHSIRTPVFFPQFLYLVSSTAIVRLSILSGWGERIFVQSFPVPQPDRFRGRMRHPLQWRRDDDRIVQRWIQRGSQKLVIWTDPILLFFGNMLPDSRCHDFERENEFLFMAARCRMTTCGHKPLRSEDNLTSSPRKRNHFEFDLKL